MFSILYISEPAERNMNSGPKIIFAYLMALGAIGGWTLGSIAAPSIPAMPNPKSSTETLVMTEAQKLKRIRESLMAQKHMEPSPKWANQKECDRMLQDLLAGRHFRAIEPFLIVESEDDPRIPEPWQACRYAEAEGDEARAQRLFNGVGYVLGDPPYRLYHLIADKDSRANWIYVAYGEPSARTGRGGWYSSVSLDKCEITGQMPTLSGSSKLNILASFRTEVVVITLIENYRLEFRSSDIKLPACGWRVTD
jgi:hypothetical protein